MLHYASITLAARGWLPPGAFAVMHRQQPACLPAKRAIALFHQDTGPGILLHGKATCTGSKALRQ